MKSRINAGDKQISDKDIKLQETILSKLNLEEARAAVALKQEIDKGVKFSVEITKEENESKIIEKINEDDVTKASIFSLDELLNSFESLSGMSKLLLTIILSSSIILGCIFSIILNIYGNYLLDRFNLEEKFPKIALFINYRRKLSKYYLISNFLIIIIMCLINLILSISILSL